MVTSGVPRFSRYRRLCMVTPEYGLGLRGLRRWMLVIAGWLQSWASTTVLPGRAPDLSWLRFFRAPAPCYQALRVEARCRLAMHAPSFAVGLPPGKGRCRLAGAQAASTWTTNCLEIEAGQCAPETRALCVALHRSLPRSSYPSARTPAEPRQPVASPSRAPLPFAAT